MQGMKAVILCNEYEKHENNLSVQTPVVLTKICGNEILKNNIEFLKKSGLDSIVLVAGKGEEKIRNFIKSNKGIWEDISLEIVSEFSLAFSNSEKKYDTVLVLQGSMFFCNVCLEDFFEYHRKKQADCSVMVNWANEISHKKGFCFCGNKNGEVTSYTENPTEENVGYKYSFQGMFLANSLILKNYFDLYDYDEIFSFENFFCYILTEKNSVFLYNCSECKFEVSNLYGFLECQNYFLKKQKEGICTKTISNFPGVTFIPPVYIGKNVTIESGCVIENSVIDDNSVILSKTDISDSYIGENTFISNRCRVKQSIVGKNVLVEKGVEFDENTLIGENCTIGTHVKICGNSQILPYVNVNNDAVINSEKIKTGKVFSRHIDEEGSYTLFSQTIDPAECVRAGQSIGTALDINDVVFVGYSENKGSAILSECIKIGLLCSGVNVCDVGECTLPMLIFALTREKGKICVFSDFLSRGKITISGKGGVPVGRRFEIAFEESIKYKNFRKSCVHKMTNNFKAIVGENEKFYYENYVKAILPPKLENLNVEIRTDSPLTAEISDKIFPYANDVNGEKIIFHISYGGRKCSAYTDKTGSVTWEKLVCLCCEYAFEKNIPVALPYVFSGAADYLAEEKNGILYRYYNSPLDKYDFMGRKTAGEMHNLFTSDGFVLAAQVCRIICEKGKSLETLLKHLPQLYSTQRFVSSYVNPIRLSKTFDCDLSRSYEGFAVNKNSGRIIVRPLKNGGGLNIFAQASNWETASDLCDDVIKRIKFLENTENIIKDEKDK